MPHPHKYSCTDLFVYVCVGGVLLYVRCHICLRVAGIDYLTAFFSSPFKQMFYFSSLSTYHNQHVISLNQWLLMSRTSSLIFKARAAWLKTAFACCLLLFLQNQRQHVPRSDLCHHPGDAGHDDLWTPTHPGCREHHEGGPGPLSAVRHPPQHQTNTVLLSVQLQECILFLKDYLKLRKKIRKRSFILNLSALILLT